MNARRMTCPKCEREVYVQPFCPFCDAILVAMWIPEGSTVARDAELAALNAERELRAEAFQRKDAQACTFECERDDARAEVTQLRVRVRSLEDGLADEIMRTGEALREVTQLRAERDAWTARRDELYAWQTDAVQELLKRGDERAAAERLAHDRGEALAGVSAYLAGLLRAAAEKEKGEGVSGEIGLTVARELSILRLAMHRIAEHPGAAGLDARRTLGEVAALEREETQPARERGC